MKIAVPTKDNNMVDDHFGHCEYFTVFTIENDKVVSKERVDSPAGCGCKSNIVETLSDMDVDVMLAGNMGLGAVNVMESYGIGVFRGCEGDIDAAVNKFLSGEICDSGSCCSGHDGCDHHSCH